MDPIPRDPPISFLERKRWFQKMAMTIVCLFFFLMFFVTALAYMRPSGSTGMDVMTMHEKRQHVE